MNPSELVHKEAQLIFWGCGIGFALLFFGGLFPISHFIPPPSPQLSGTELLALYGPHILAVKTCVLMGIVGSSLLIPWSVMVAVQVSRMEQGRQLPIWAITSLIAGCVNAVAFILPFVFWAAAFYRVDRAPDLVQLISDMSWLEFLMFAPPFSMQLLCVAFGGLTQKSGPEVFPRWYLFLNIWMAVLGLPGIIAIYFFTGPFAWNGLIGFWLPVGSYGLFLPVTFYQFYQAINKHPGTVSAGTS